MKFTTIASILTLTMSMTLSAELTTDAERTGVQTQDIFEQVGAEPKRPFLGQKHDDHAQVTAQVDSEAQTITLAEKRREGVRRLVSQMGPKEIKARIAAAVKHQYDDEE